MQRLSGTSMLAIPGNLKIEELMNNLEIGHGYVWTRLTEYPKLWAHGNPPPGDLPEVLIIGRMLLFEGKEEYSERFRRMLQALSQHYQIAEGGSIG
ncbi:MAG: hypothetical protein ACFFD3_04560 [Candidatus Thorarchaeota archaeon]